MNLLEVSEAGLFADTVDKLFEIYLSHLLDHFPSCHTEILLYNQQDALVPVAFAKWTGPEGEKEKKILSEYWALDNPKPVTIRRIRFFPMQPLFSIPLLGPEKILGFLNVQLDKFEVLDLEQLKQINLLGMQIAAKLKQILLEQDINQLKKDLADMANHNNDTQNYATSLSKELYAISALTTKINLSMDFEKSLRKSMDTTCKVFKADCVLVYAKMHEKYKADLVAIEPAASWGVSILKEYLQQLEKKCLAEIMQSDKPVIKDKVAQYLHADLQAGTVFPFKSLIGIALKSKGTTRGAMILLHKDPQPINQSGMRLLSGMANIMGMAIENKELFQRSEQKKSESDFLVQSIVKFNATLDLKAILRSVAEKGVEYAGPASNVYLLSQMKTPFVVASYADGHGRGTIQSIDAEKFTSREIKLIYHQISGQLQGSSKLIKNINYMKRFSLKLKAACRALNIHSMIAVPLQVRGNHLGLLLFTRSKEATPFKSHECSFAEALAGAAIMTIENASVYSASQELSDFLEKKITEKSAQIEHIQARQLTRVENRNDMVFQVNLTNKFVFANKAMEDLTGFSREELCHKDFKANQIIAPEDRGRIADIFRQIIRKEVALVKGVEYRQLNRKGGERIISLTVYPDFDQNDRVAAVEGIGLDITEKKRLKKELKKTKELAMLGEFSAAIAHQMRNPLGNILIGTKRLQKALGLAVWQSTRASGNDAASIAELQTDPQVLDDIITDVFSGVSNLNQVVTELLEYTKTLKPSFSWQKIDIALQDTLHPFQPLTSQGKIEIEENFDPQVPPVPMDAFLMGQAFQNVIHNAVQAMPEGGRLLLSTSFYEEQRRNIMVSVTDSGGGIKESELEKIFRPFYTTKKNGVGLGLSLTHRIIEAHGGTVWACRNPCKHLARHFGCSNPILEHCVTGTTVHILLPMTQQSAELLPKEN